MTTKPEAALRPNRMKRLGIVDALRGIASLGVCLGHFTICAKTFFPDGALKTALSFGSHGVDVFFVISGFIIPFALHRAGYQVGQYGRFVLKRMVRLDPPYLATIALILVLGFLSAKAPGYQGPPFEVSVAQVLLHVAYLNVFFQQPWLNTVFWTLAVEFQYYLLVGLAYPCIAHKTRVARLGFFSVLGFLAILLPGASFIPHWFFLFMLGMLAFQRHAGLLDGVEFWVVLALLACGAWRTLGPLAALVGLASAGAIVFANTGNRLLLFFGSISYSLYLLHMPVGMRVVNLGSRFARGMTAKLFVFALALAVTIAASYLLYLVVEYPAQKWSSKIKYQRGRSPAAPPSVKAP
jgi:peptidoglycan/LPS O-acetylase OafA/YrhL